MAMQILKTTFKDFLEDDCPTRAAALSYYTVFALPPLLILIITVIGFAWDEQTVQRVMEGQAASLIGADAAGQIHEIIARANRPGGNGPIAFVLGLVGIIFGATGVVMQLQAALNRAWEVGPDPDGGGIVRFVLKRGISLLMILAVAVLLLASLILSTMLSAFGQVISDALGGLPAIALSAFDLLVSLIVITPLFAVLFKFLPDARIQWRDAFVGGLMTAILFVVGKFAIGLYLGQSNPGEAFGAAGALAILLVWIYYSGIILLLGAEFTQAWATKKGARIEPAKGAVRLVFETRHVGRPA